MRTVLRLGSFFVAGLIFCSLLAQQPPARSDRVANLFQTVRPVLTYVIHKHATGADMVELTVLDAQFPPEALNGIVARLGDLLGNSARGLHVFATPLGSKGTGNVSMLKATFAINGILNGAQGIKIQPLIQAVAGGSDHSRVEGLAIILDGITATSLNLRSFATSSVRLQGVAVLRPPALEYRVQLLSQHPADLLVPDSTTAALPARREPRAESGKPAWILWFFVLLAALAAGALVYNLTLKRRPRTRSALPPVHR